MTALEWIGLFTILGLEYIFPKIKYKNLIFKKGLIEDLFYMVLIIYFLQNFFSWLNLDFDNFFSNHTIMDFSRFHIVVQFIIYFVLSDFLRFLMHFSMHRFPLMWAFHRLHHSAEELTATSSMRSSFTEDLALSFCVLIPLSVLRFNDDVRSLTLTIFVLHGFYLHSNVNFKMPWFLKFICSNHYHHWHHSVEDKISRGQNFGVTFTVWDKLFGYYYGSEENATSYGLANGAGEKSNYLNKYFNPFFK